MSEGAEQITYSDADGPAVREDRGGSPDLDVIARDLADVEAALGRLNAGTYWTDEVSGQPINEELLVAEPLRRTAGPRSTLAE